MLAKINDLKIWVRLVASIGIVLVLAGSIFIYRASIEQQRIATEQAQDFANTVYQMTMASLTGMMMAGTVSQRADFLDQARRAETIKGLKVVRSEAVIKQFGPGYGDEAKVDEVEKQVLQTGKPYYEVRGSDTGDILKAVVPAVATKNSMGLDCLNCHSVEEGAVLGAVSMDISLSKVNASVRQFNLKIIGLGLGIGVPLLYIVFVFISRVVLIPLRDMTQSLRDIAHGEGDLTRRLPVRANDEIGHAARLFNQVMGKFQDVLRHVSTAAKEVSATAGEIEVGTADLSQRTEEQASSLEETASSMDELTSTVKQNAGSARDADKLAQEATEVALKGGEVVSQIVGTMDEIHQSSNKMMDIISVIDGIAFQTNILALNAAVEAARAGEQGRGFAVVAAEVRALAQRSAAAAKEIKSLINTSVEKVEAGAKLVEDVVHTMSDIVASVRRVSSIMSEIAAASQEQSAGIEQINQTVMQMDRVTQQNAALVEQAAAAAESLQAQADSLASAVSRFILGTETPGVFTRPTAALQQRPPEPVGHASIYPPDISFSEGTKQIGSPKKEDTDWKEF